MFHSCSGNNLLFGTPLSFIKHIMISIVLERCHKNFFIKVFLKGEQTPKKDLLKWRKKDNQGTWSKYGHFCMIYQCKTSTCRCTASDMSTKPTAFLSQNNWISAKIGFKTGWRSTTLMLHNQAKIISRNDIDLLMKHLDCDKIFPECASQKILSLKSGSHLPIFLFA